MQSLMQCYALRLRPGEDLRASLISYVQKHNLRAAFILSCVGSVTGASIRTADSVSRITLKEQHEIVSLVGTLSGGSGHLHICLSDKDGKTVGGHLLSDAPVFTTAEIILGELMDLTFKREYDDATGYPELTISRRTELK